MHIRYCVELDPSERQQLEALVAGGTRAVRRVKRAQILLAADAGHTDAQIAATLRVGTSTVYRTKQHFFEIGLERALSEAPRPGRRLAENHLKPWREKMWCVPQIDAAYVARMEDVLELYTTLPRLGTAVVCVDETPRQLIGEVRPPSPPAPGHVARRDAEYQRNGTANVFVAVDAHQPRRYTKVTTRRTAVDFAEWLRDLVDLHYAGTERIQIVLDNLSTHTPAALYEAFPPAEARRVLRRLEWHYVPKHASWLNMVEIEIGVLSAQCLDRRIPDLVTLTNEVEAWTQARNAAGARVRWMFGIEQARTKLGRAYPSVVGKQAAA